MRALLVAAALLLPAVAVADPTPEEVLAGIDGAYAKVKVAKLEFTQTTKDAVFGTDAKSRGTIEISRPNLRWTYFDKSGDESKIFIANSKKLIYVNKLNKTWSQAARDDSQVPAALSWLTRKGRLAKEFSPVITATTKSTIELELTPLKASAAYSKIKLVVDAKTFRVQESVVTASNGNTNGYKFNNVDVGATIDARRFQFRKESKDLDGYREDKLSTGAAPTAP
jgi:outer membrane lipoprotein-sorting protein